MNSKYSSKRTDKTYRKVYTTHYGSIPYDENGRRYEIHHIDGNHDNNDITNLVAVTIKEHYAIHYAQNDFAACMIMTKRMNISSKEKSDLARKSILARMANSSYVNPFSKRSDGTSVASDRAKNGTLHTIGQNMSGRNSPSYDTTLYQFINCTDEIVEMTAYDLTKTYKLIRGNVSKVISGERNSTGGWRLYTSILKLE